jgi:[ribosomal protein S5]-alanine N-acetyltransferase
MEIVFEDISLRPWRIGDAVRLAEIADNKDISDNLRDGFPYPYTLQDAIRWLNIILPVNFPPRYFSVTYNEGIVGSIGIELKSDIYRKNAEIGYFLVPDHWNKGIMTKAIKAVSAYTFREFDVIRIYADIFCDNAGSGRVLEKAGFTHEATIRKGLIKNDVIKDACIFSLLREDFKPEKDPDRIKSL